MSYQFKISLAVLLLVSAQLLLKFQLLTAGWIVLDDPAYVISNSQVITGLNRENALWAFTTVYYGNWMPLTWASYQLDISLFGAKPFGFHLTNLILDTATALSLFYFLITSTKSLFPSFLVCLLFIVHPLHVEPVAWISGRKDLLAGLFWVLTLVAYRRYCFLRSIFSYLLLVGTYCLALLSKPSAATLPFVLLVLDFWPFNRLLTSGKIDTSRLLEKLPLVILAVCAAIPSVIGLTTPGTDLHSGFLEWPELLKNIFRFMGQYFHHALAPFNIAVEYPHPTTTPFSLLDWTSIICLCLLSGYSVLKRKSYPWLLSGLLWFFLSISLSLQFRPISNQSTADRYMYVPLIGLLLAFSWQLAQMRNLILRSTIASALIFSFTLIALKILPTWKDSKSLFQHAANAYPNSPKAWTYLGDAYLEQRQSELAVACYLKALISNPEEVAAFLRLKTLYHNMNRQAKPRDWIYFSTDLKQELPYSKNIARAMILAHAQRVETSCSIDGVSCLAIADSYFDKSYKEKPTEPQTLEALHLLAGTHYQMNSFKIAAELFERYLQFSPDRIESAIILADCYIELGSLQRAEDLLKEIKLKPDNLSASQNQQLDYLKAKLSKAADNPSVAPVNS